MVHFYILEPDRTIKKKVIHEVIFCKFFKKQKINIRFYRIHRFHSESFNE